MTNLKKNLVQFLAYHLFQILKKVYLQTLRNPRPSFGLFPFQILKKVYLEILKKSRRNFLLLTFFYY